MFDLKMPEYSYALQREDKQEQKSFLLRAFQLF